jgi:hypothetical protein
MTNNLEPFQIGDMWGYKDQKGLEVIEPKFAHARNFSEGLAVVKINDKWGYIKETGGEVIPFWFDKADSFTMGDFMW